MHMHASEENVFAEHTEHLRCCAAGVDVAITRTPFATPLILTTLSGHPEVCRNELATQQTIG